MFGLEWCHKIISRVFSLNLDLENNRFQKKRDKHPTFAAARAPSLANFQAACASAGARGPPAEQDRFGLRFTNYSNKRTLPSTASTSASSWLSEAVVTGAKRLMMLWKREATAGMDARGNVASIWRSNVATVTMSKSEQSTICRLCLIEASESMQLFSYLGQAFEKSFLQSKTPKHVLATAIVYSQGSRLRAGKPLVFAKSACNFSFWCMTPTSEKHCIVWCRKFWKRMRFPYGA